jgi:hypothetical protein
LHKSKQIRVDFRFGKYLFVRAVMPRGSSPFDPTNYTAEWELPSMKKKSTKVAEGEGTHLAPIETEYLSKLLPLVEHCCCRKYDDGDPREPGWLTVKTSGSAWIVQVKDPDSGCSFQAVGETLDKALESAALLLSCDEAPWEPDQWLKARKGQKKSK